jgi:hypothetical protein
VPLYHFQAPIELRLSGPMMLASKFGLGGKMAENRDDDPETEEQRRERRR